MRLYLIIFFLVLVKCRQGPNGWERWGDVDSGSPIRATDVDNIVIKAAECLQKEVIIKNDTCVPTRQAVGLHWTQRTRCQLMHHLCLERRPANSIPTFFGFLVDGFFYFFSLSLLVVHHMYSWGSLARISFSNSPIMYGI